MSDNLFLLAGIFLSIVANHLILKVVFKGENSLPFLERLRSTDLKELEWSVVNSVAGGVVFLILRAGGFGLIWVAAAVCFIGSVLFGKVVLKITFKSGIIMFFCSSVAMFLIWYVVMISPMCFQALQNS